MRRPVSKHPLLLQGSTMHSNCNSHSRLSSASAWWRSWRTRRSGSTVLPWRHRQCSSRQACRTYCKHNTFESKHILRLSRWRKYGRLLRLIDHSFHVAEGRRGAQLKNTLLMSLTTGLNSHPAWSSLVRCRWSFPWGWWSILLPRTETVKSEKLFWKRNEYD